MIKLIGLLIIVWRWITDLQRIDTARSVIQIPQNIKQYYNIAAIVTAIWTTLLWGFVAYLIII